MRFFVPEYPKRHFTALFCRKKQVEKMATFGPKQIGSVFFPFAEMAIFGLFELPFLKPRNAFFILEYRKTHFPSLYCRKKKKLKKCHFWTKTIG